MKKSLKKMLATVSAVAMCALTTVNVNVFAVEAGSPVDNMIKSYGEPYLTYEKDKEVFVVKENENHLLTQRVDVYINMKDGKTLPKINLENSDIRIADVGYQFVKYRLTSENDKAEKQAVDAISKCDEVLSVDKVYTVYGEPAYSFVEGAWVKLNDETKDILSEYEFSDDEYVLGYWNDGTPITSDEYKYIQINSNAECYAFMEKMQDNNIEYELNICCASNFRHIIAEETVNLYTSPDYDLNDNIAINSPEPTLLGDANEDGKVTIADAVLIMQALSNPNDFQLTPQGMANADMVGDGDGVTVMDALRIQEMEINM
ncbi:MAG: dockerin type I repeat-containing protein [Ruminococcus sp.]|nr:dockerin type I repeat-containing protein [Ruminococcus sp.]